MPNKRILIFLVMSGTSGLLEIGVVVRALAADGLFAAFLAALAYQLGTLVPHPIRISSRAVAVFAVFGAIGGGAAAALMIWGDAPRWLDYPVIAATSLLIQVSRAQLGKSEIPTTTKRIARIAGFFASPLLVLPPALPALLLLAGVVAVATAPGQFDPATSRGQVHGPLNRLAAMGLITHQVHYFSYCTMTLATLVLALGAPFGIGLFVCGWLTYVSLPHIVGHRQSNARVALIGHVALVPTLIALGSVPPAGIIYCILWMLTGFCGGTVVYLTRSAHVDHGFNEHELASCENVGHCLGSALALCLATIAASPATFYAAAALMAAITAATLLIGRIRLTPRAAAGDLG